MKRAAAGINNGEKSMKRRRNIENEKQQCDNEKPANVEKYQRKKTISMAIS
jgi:hypothetical protein